MVTIRQVQTRKDRKRFICFQNRLYRDIPQYVPTLLSDELANLDPKKNPAFEYCEMRFFLAEREGKIVGRIGGIISHKANEIWGVRTIRITRMDFIDDAEVADALVQTIAAWGREQGMERIIGPIGFCDLDKEGMLVDGFERPGMFITYYNFPYYVEHMQRMGFGKEVDWTCLLYTSIHGLALQQLLSAAQLVDARRKLRLALLIVVILAFQDEIQPFCRFHRDGSFVFLAVFAPIRDSIHSKNQFASRQKQIFQFAQNRFAYAQIRKQRNRAGGNENIVILLRKVMLYDIRLPGARIRRLLL